MLGALNHLEPIWSKTVGPWALVLDPGHRFWPVGQIAA